SALQPVLKIWDAFITKLSPGGALVYSTYLGGSDTDWGQAIAVDRGENVYISGYTQSTDYPVKDPVQGACAPPSCFDAIVTKINAAGSAIVYSTYLGGGSESVGGPGAWDFGRGIAVDPSADAYVAGETYATDFPTVNAFQPSSGGDVDGFVARIATNQPPVCAAAFASPATLWPPNGKLVPIAIRGVTDPDGDSITFEITGVRQDEPLQGAPNAFGLGTATVQLRSDRAGGGDGRVYRITFEASDGNGGVCTGTVAVCVPHDQGRGRRCGDGGGLFDSTGSGR
ncbi:MAG: SBBP repeat-containing protein, partial [Thermoanaerobaculia bacterium]